MVYKLSLIIQLLLLLSVNGTPLVINNLLYTNKRLVIRQRRQAYRDQNYPLSIWSDGPIPFTISSSLPAHAVTIILKAIKFWQQNTCINFEQNSKGINVIDFVRGNGCYSAIGRVWFQRRQELSVGSVCEHFHTVTHELAHALGIFHTQSRPDRSRYVIINEQNAYRSQKTNFRAEKSAKCATYDIPYEYGSVMHYRNHEFSVNRQATVVPRNPLHVQTMGSGTGPSFLDVLLVNQHYNCLSRCAGTGTDCKNGGYPHPRNCDTCMCPSGFAGTYCEKKQESPGCGGTYYASAVPAELSHRMGTYTLKDDMEYCYWWIIAPYNEHIEIEILNLSAPCWEGCLFGGLEIKGALDKRLTGYRFCCTKPPGKRIIAPGGILPIIAFNRESFTSFTIQYRTVPYSQKTTEDEAEELMRYGEDDFKRKLR